MTQLRRHGLEKRPRTDVRCYVNLGPSFLHCEGVKPRPCMGGGVSPPSGTHTPNPAAPPHSFLPGAEKTLYKGNLFEKHNFLLQMSRSPCY